MNQKHRWNSTGYDAEELYFEKLNRELIQKLHEGEKTGEQSSEQANGQSGPGAQVIAFPQRQTQTQKKAA